MAGWLRRAARRTLGPLRDFWAAPVAERLRRLEGRDVARERRLLRRLRASARESQRSLGPAQVAVALEYRRLACERAPLPSLREVGFGVYSEGDEDGILLFLFALLGAPLRTLVDVGAGWLQGSNSANLILHHGWHGLLIEADPQRAGELGRFYREHPRTAVFPPRVVAARLSRADADEVIRAGLEGRDADLLCIDVDGVDYWLWQAITCIRPRVVVVEFQTALGPEVSLTVPYRDDFEPVYEGRFGVYCGASLAALAKLARRKGYRLVGAQQYGYNAFFVREDLEPGRLPEATPAACFTHPFAAWSQRCFAARARAHEWVEV